MRTSFTFFASCFLFMAKEFLEYHYHFLSLTDPGTKIFFSIALAFVIGFSIAGDICEIEYQSNRI